MDIDAAYENAFEYLCDKLGREPTQKEVEELLMEAEARAYDQWEAEAKGN